MSRRWDNTTTTPSLFRVMSKNKEETGVGFGIVKITSNKMCQTCDNGCLVKGFVKYLPEAAASAAKTVQFVSESE